MRDARIIRSISSLLVVVAATAAEAQTEAKPSEPSSAGAPPGWVFEDWQRRVGTWIADNEAYKEDDGSLDAYGVEWKWGIGEKSLVGRLYGIRDGSETNTFWEFREFWHPGERRVVVMQFGGNGTYGVGASSPPDDGWTEMVQTFYNPGSGRVFEVGHRARLDGDEQETRSFDVSESGKWTPRRTYVWRRRR